MRRYYDTHAINKYRYDHTCVIESKRSYTYKKQMSRYDHTHVMNKKCVDMIVYICNKQYLNRHTMNNKPHIDN